MNIEQIFKNNEVWVNEKLGVDSEYFKNLASGQNPDILYIGCSDSRVTAEEVMGVKPGDVFVMRNISNMVSNLDLSAMSVIDYAVSVLQVKNIVICGHYGCGGVKAAMQSKDLGILNPWLRNIRDVYRLHRDELNDIEDEEEKYRRLVELNVQEQCVNVIKTADVQIAVRKGQLAVHGWVMDMATGKLIDLKIDFEKVLEGIMEIYHLDKDEIDSK
ncbi:carbonic anhydrase [Aequorivita sublithincola DSM 14238]|uniref:Carbonic anhydrase 2 n=1 Tax=Aequorivita sublithincola (strain DSM 14238 / LMG 21431 / ACAM 643 / 9-3) TaxID=746697 RepID=I3YT16_AEQSU|nr:carbonic anhydrase [Aequorivita sublithincola]AFL80134.1 carbonic anhydrase [Aequorivita sublithincola DSM 14238]